MKKIQNVYLCRHGETKWSLSGQHTSFTDLPLTEKGEEEALALKEKIKNQTFKKIFSSPLIRASETAKLCGFHNIELENALLEWNYGDYEGLTTNEIHKSVPDWNIFTHGAKNGEDKLQIQKRLDPFIETIIKIDGDVCLFSSGHISRALIARWIEQDISMGKHFLLSTASLTILSFERENRVIRLLNETFI